MSRIELFLVRGVAGLVGHLGSLAHGLTALLSTLILWRRAVIIACVIGLVGCAGPHKSHLPDDLAADAAHRITHALVNALSRTEIRAAGDPLCIESAASAPVFEQALRMNLRGAGYAVMQKAAMSNQAPSPECLAFLGEERLVEQGLSRIGLYCLCMKGGSICREYRLPDAKPVSSLSVAGLTYHVQKEDLGQQSLPAASSGDRTPVRSATSNVQSGVETGASATTTKTTTSLQVRFPYRGEILTSTHRAQLLRLVRDPRLRMPARARVIGVSTRPDGYGDALLAKRRASIVANAIKRIGPEGLVVEVDARDQLLAQAPDLTRGVLVQLMFEASRHAKNSTAAVRGE